jgi:putative DNA primase/helicase
VESNDQVAEAISPDSKTNLADEEVVKRARSAANSAKFERLWRGDTGDYDSHSEADMALCCLLAF